MRNRCSFKNDFRSFDTTVYTKISLMEMVKRLKIVIIDNVRVNGMKWPSNRELKSGGTKGVTDKGKSHEKRQLHGCTMNLLAQKRGRGRTVIRIASKQGIIFRCNGNLYNLWQKSTIFYYIYYFLSLNKFSQLSKRLSLTWIMLNSWKVTFLRSCWFLSWFGYYSLLLNFVTFPETDEWKVETYHDPQTSETSS